VKAVVEDYPCVLSHAQNPLLHVAVLIPIRDDWASASQFLLLLDQAISAHACIADVLLVDDGSTQSCPAEQFRSRYAVIRSIHVLRLRRNLGHQRSIAIGLVHIKKAMPCDAVLVMDGDGEDTPDGALQLLCSFSGTTAVFAERSRRTESFVFRVFYQLYKILHLALTSVAVKMGNFSILPWHYLDTLVVMSELWNHYAAAVVRSRLPYDTTPIPRGRRIAGESRMNFVSLVTHGMSAISVFGDIVGVRLLLATIIGSCATILCIVTVLIIRFFTHLAIPGWATYSTGTLAIILIQLLTIGASFTFTFLSNRTDFSFIPLRDYESFVGISKEIYHND
jgi:glycosyltransferase involved in cell wall biosynthesis